MRQFILDFISSNGGCKFSDLYIVGIKNYTYDQLSSTVCALVQEQEIVEVRYFIKDVHGDRIGFLLPKDTSVRVTRQIF